MVSQKLYTFDGFCTILAKNYHLCAFFGGAILRLKIVLFPSGRLGDFRSLSRTKYLDI